MIDGKSILITGATGSFGQKFVDIVAAKYRPERLIIFSRDELKQSEMRARHPETKDSPIRYFIGDIRDKDRLYRAFDRVDIVVHAAALKQVPVAEYNPLETIRTNVMGSANLIDAALDRGVEKVIFLSTDKAVNPVNLYGATKLCAEKLFVAARAYAGGRTKFSVVRYGNVVGSRGSVVPLFLEQAHTGKLPITDPRMTRFWITLEQGVQFVLQSLELMHGGETFVPKIPSMNIADLARVIGPDCEQEIVGIRPGEKLHELLITQEDAERTLRYQNFFVIMPSPADLTSPWGIDYTCEKVEDGFAYRSDLNPDWLGDEALREMVYPDA